MNPLVENWFKQHQWEPFEFQRRTWDAIADGKSGLLHAPTGYGKTYAAWFGALLQWLDQYPDRSKWPDAVPLRVLWITPLRSLSNDTVEALNFPVNQLEIPWTIVRRTADSTSAEKMRTRKKPPTALVTTPESLSLLLSYPDLQKTFCNLQCVVVDEWHEQIGTKRGVQTELALARLREWNPEVLTWGISATLGNTRQAMEVLLGPKRAGEGLLIEGIHPKEIVIETAIPEKIEKFPWAGHLGTKLVPQVVEALKEARSTLLFTNTRSQAELWHQAILSLCPEWEHELGLHHGSVDREFRGAYEEGLRRGLLRCVVCTSSLDLGVDFTSVDQVIQVGSPKGVARLMQRAGRSGHQPGTPSRILCVPTHAFELIEFAAIRDAVEARRIESREPIERPLDVLVQHLVTLAVGGGFGEEAMRREIRTTHAYKQLSDREWNWALNFVTHGGEALSAYPEYAKVVKKNNRFIVESRRVGRFHRMGIGTITSDEMVHIKYAKGGRLGSVEESFVAKMKPGDRFVFAGRTLEFIRLKDMVATVRRSTSPSRIVPRWMGGRLPLSSQLAQAVRERLLEARSGTLRGAEMEAVAPILEIQERWSRLPVPGELLIEQVDSRDGTHLFLYPLAGRLVHEGLGPLIAWRLSQRRPLSFSIFQNDYGIELLCPKKITADELDWKIAFSTEHLVEDLLACMNASQLARQRFREIARVAGLVFQGYPGRSKTARQLQASSGLLYDVFRQFDPDNLLIAQAEKEVLESQLEIKRMRRALEEFELMEIIIEKPPRLTPFAFPLWVDRMRHQVSSEKWSHRVERMIVQLERSAGKEKADERVAG